MNEKEKEEINKITDELAGISGSLQGVITAASNDKYCIDRIFELSYEIQNQIGKLHKMMKW